MWKFFSISIVRYALVIVLTIWGLHNADAQENTITLDFVDTPLADVARALSLAYDTPILVDEHPSEPVTFHLEGVGLFEGLSALCESIGMDLVQVGRIFHIRKNQHLGEMEISVRDSTVDFYVKNENVRDFVEAFSLNTGINVFLDSEITGTVSGRVVGLPGAQALQHFLESQSFLVQKRGDSYFVKLRKNGSGSLELPKNLELYENDGKYYVEAEGVPLMDFLRRLSNAANMNLAVYGDVQESLWLKFERIPLKQLLKAVFNGSRYSYTLDSTGLYVAEKNAKNVFSSTRLVPLKHLHSEKALPQLEKMLPGNGIVASEVKEQNAILLGGTLGDILRAESLLAQIDIPSMQITLSCVLVEFKKGRGFEIGLHSGASRKTPEKDVGVRGFLDFLGRDVSRSGAYGKIGILPDRFEVELASMEENNQAEILARPRLTTLNGNKAELNVTNTVYYMVSQVSPEGYPITDYRSFNDGISLELTPYVTQEGRITLNVSPEIKTAGRSSGDGPRDISTRNLNTTVVLKNGETLCLGGLVRKNTSEIKTAIPFLGSIPVIGALFRYTSQQEEESELAIFITPEVQK